MKYKSFLSLATVSFVCLSFLPSCLTPDGPKEKKEETKAATTKAKEIKKEKPKPVKVHDMSEEKDEFKGFLKVDCCLEDKRAHELRANALRSRLRKAQGASGSSHKV